MPVPSPEAVLEFSDEDCLGRVQAVDTSIVTLVVDDLETLQRLKVNRLVAIRMRIPHHFLIGMVARIKRSTREPVEPVDSALGNEGSEYDDAHELNVVRIVLVGTYKGMTKSGVKHVFVRSLEQVASIDDPAFALEGAQLSFFMQCISRVARKDAPLRLGTYTLDDSAYAYLDGNRFFQRHAVIVGSTGSGKSYTTAHLLEQIARLPNGNALVFDIHGEYVDLGGDDGIETMRIAGPADIAEGKGLSEGAIHLPYWLLRYEALQALLLEMSDANAPTQAAMLAQAVQAAKQELLDTAGETELLESFTLDSPLPFDMSAVVGHLERLNTEMVPGANAKRSRVTTLASSRASSAG